MTAYTGWSFEWDDAKAASNILKHGISFPYAARVFLDPEGVELDAHRPEDGEVRRKAVGQVEERVLCVVFTVRNGVVRLISARQCNAKEGREYDSVQTRSH